MFADDGKPTAEVARLLKAGASVTGVDLLYQGEFLADGKPLTQTPVTGNSREFAGYTHGFNRTVLANRVHDVLNVLSYLHGHEKSPKEVSVVALDETAPIAAVARALAPDRVSRLAIDTQGFRFGKVASYRDPAFLPGGAKYHDLPGAMGLASGGPTFIAGETADSLNIFATQRPNIHLSTAKQDVVAAAAIDWLLK
jgi:hypothetical protein